jgi:hypothetical protein
MERLTSSRTSGRRPRGDSAALRRARRLLNAETGIGLIETLIALLIFAVVSTALIGTLVSSTSVTTAAKANTIAEEGVSSEIEMIKNWASTPDPNSSNSPTYDDIGTNPVGNPYGALPQSQVFKGVNGETLGMPAHMKITVAFASANVPGAYTNGIDYKKVTVTITRDSDSRVLSSATAFVAPPTRAAGNTATINATIADYDTKLPVAGAGLALGTGPSAPRSDTSDSLGNVTFQGLTYNPTSGSQAYYDLTVTPPTGYVVLSDTAYPNAAAHFQLSPSQTYATTLYVYQPVTAAVSLFNGDGTPYTNNATVNVSTNPNRGTQAASYTGSPITISTLSNGEQLVPGVTYTISASQSGSTSNVWANTIPNGTPAYPTSLSSNISLTMPTGTLTVTVTNSKSSSPPKCSGASVTVSGGGLSSPLTGTTNSSGVVTFTDVPAASIAPLYTIAATATSGKTGSLTGKTVSTSGSNPYTVKVSGTTSSC